MKSIFILLVWFGLSNPAEAQVPDRPHLSQTSSTSPYSLMDPPIELGGMGGTDLLSEISALLAEQREREIRQLEEDAAYLVELLEGCVFGVPEGESSCLDPHYLVNQYLAIQDEISRLKASSAWGR